MRITDELREWAHGFNGPWKRNEEMLLAIADRIDAECDEAIQQALMGEGSVPATDENMAELGWVRLPLDADGVPIRIGDVIAYKDNTKPKEVVALVPPSVVMVEDGPRYANMCRHYHAPTVEDVLREFADEVYADADNEIRDRDFLCAKYAKRLTLAGDAE